MRQINRVIYAYIYIEDRMDDMLDGSVSCEVELLFLKGPLCLLRPGCVRRLGHVTRQVIGELPK